jgi:hypothetical protein
MYQGRHRDSFKDQVNIVARLNNVDGTYDFIIQCTEETASLLRNCGLILAKDAPYATAGDILCEIDAFFKK